MEECKRAKQISTQISCRVRENFETYNNYSHRVLDENVKR